MDDVLEDFDFCDTIVEGLQQVGQTVQLIVVTEHGKRRKFQFGGVEWIEARRFGEVFDWHEVSDSQAISRAVDLLQRTGHEPAGQLRQLCFLCAENFPFLTIVFLTCREVEQPARGPLDTSSQRISRITRMNSVATGAIAIEDQFPINLTVHLGILL